MQYSVSNLNAFIILVSIGFSLYCLVNKNKDYTNLQDKNNSPIQLISEIKGYFYINPILALSLAITLFSFIGVPPLIGFFAKQIVLSAALDNGYVFMALVAILTSVISAVYYLAVIKQIFFDKSEYELNSELNNLNLFANIASISKEENVKVKQDGRLKQDEKVKYDIGNIVLSSSLTTIISILTLIILLFIFIPHE